MAVLTNPITQTITDNTVLTAVAGKNYVVTNGAGTSKTVTFGGDSRLLQPDESIHLAYDGTNWLVVAEPITSLSSRVSTIEAERLEQDTTVNFTTAQTSAQKQALINAQPINLNGYTLTFQFEDGTHNHTSTLSFPEFHGTFNVRGNISDSTSSSTKSVIINMGSNNTPAFSFSGCSGLAELAYLKIIGTGWASLSDSIVFIQNCSVFSINAIAINGSGQGRLLINRSFVNNRFGYFQNMARALNAEIGSHLSDVSSTFTSNTTDIVSAGGTIVLSSQSSATITKASGGIIYLNGVLS